METSRPSTSMAKKGRKLKPVTVLCSKCNRGFQTKARAHLCPNCRPKKGQVTQPATQTPKPKPQRPNKPKPQPAQQVTQKGMMQASRAMSNMQLVPVNQLTGRVNNNASLKKPGGGVRSAIERLVLATLDPSAACGQTPLRVNVDQIQLPKFPIQMDNNFVIESLGPYKIMLNASPLIIATAISKTPADGEPQNFNVYGSKYIQFDDQAGNRITNIISNKLAYIGALDDRYAFLPKDDFRKFRLVSAAMRSQWAGAELFKNGIAVTARLTDKEDLVDFEPNSKPDNVSSNGSDVIVTSCQHAEPVFEFQDVDTNNESGGGIKPSPDKQAFATYNFNAVAANNVPSPDGDGSGFVLPGLVFALTASNTVRYACSTFLGAMQTRMSASQAHLAASAKIVDALANKYKNFRGRSGAWNCKWSVSVYVNYFPGATDVVILDPPICMTATGANVPNVGSQDFFSRLMAEAATALPANGSVLNPGVESLIYYGHVDITVELPIDGTIDQRVFVPTPLTPALRRNELGETPYYDDSFLQPVTSVLPSASIASGVTFQYQTTHVFEFVLGDTTVLATQAVADAPTDSGTTVSKKTFDIYQKIMKGMPPALIMSGTGGSRAGYSQLESRGIIKDIYNIAGPILASLFPSAAPFVGAAAPLVGLVDGLV